MTRVDIAQEQITAAQAGDSTAMWEIVEAFDGMFRGMIRSVAPTASREDAEDLLQEARAVLIQHVLPGGPTPDHGGERQSDDSSHR
jgi:RNA polymerase primary sigma factor